jgi:hypothetical protein
MLNKEAVTGLRDILQSTNQLHGWAIPNTVVSWQAELFAEKIDKNPWQPEPSYAERYLSIRSIGEALALGNTCFFTRSVFPELGQRRGINSSYYVQLGQGCYDYMLQRCDNPTLELVAKNFEFLAEAAYTAIRSYGDFRSMWD